MMFPLFDCCVLATARDQHEDIRMKLKIIRLEEQVRDLRLEVETLKREMYLSRTLFSPTYGPYTCKLSLREAVKQLMDHAGLALTGSHAKEATATLEKQHRPSRWSRLTKCVR